MNTRGSTDLRIHSPSRGLSSYDLLYLNSRGGQLWGDQPGRLLGSLHDFVSDGYVVDAGCGDGKNALSLEKQGFKVLGFDASPIAIESLYRRFQRNGWSPTGQYCVMDAMNPMLRRRFDVLVSYGLYHCLDKENRITAHRALQDTVLPGGVVLFTTLLNDLPLPPYHGTLGVTLSSLQEIHELFEGWRIEHWETGIIEEEHLPVAGTHTHSAVWLIARKIPDVWRESL